MKTGKVIRIAWNGLAKNPLRSLLTMLGVIIGVAAVIIMIAISSGTEKTIEEQITGLGTNLVASSGTANGGSISALGGQLSGGTGTGTDSSAAADRYRSTGAGTSSTVDTGTGTTTSDSSSEETNEDENAPLVVYPEEPEADVIDVVLAGERDG